MLKNRILGKRVVACALLVSVAFLGQEKPAVASNVCPGQVCVEHEVQRHPRKRHCEVPPFLMCSPGSHALGVKNPLRSVRLGGR